MIGRIQGKLSEKQAPHLLIDVHGVGYELQAPMSTFYKLPELGDTALLHTHFAVSETSQQLFGFVEKKDRDFFRLLIKVNGVGPKMAIGIMCMESDDIVRCIMENNINALVKVPGVGKKTAERLVIDMRDKVKDWSIPAAGPSGLDEDAGGAGASGTQNALIAEAESALVALGYKPTEAAKAVSRVVSGDIARSEDLIKLALRSMIPA